MNKIKERLLDNLPTIFVVLVFLFGMTLVFNHAKAIPNTEPDSVVPKIEPERKYNLDRLYQQNIPAYCGETNFVFKTSENLMLESQILVGEVRVQGQPENDIIGILSFGHSVERNSGTFFMTLPGVGPMGTSITCIIGYGLNWQFFDDNGDKVIQQDSL